MGRINGSVSRNSDSYSFYIDWSETIPSDYISTNKTTVTATAYIYCSAHSAWASNLTQTLVIDGTTFTDTKTVNLSSGVTVTLVTGTKEITHNSDGSKSITISADCDLPYGNGWGPDRGTASGSATLTTIPRKSTFTVTSGSVNYTKPKFTISRKSDSFKHTIKYVSFADNSQEITIVDKTSSTTYEEWTPPTTFYQYFPNDQKITITYKLYTYNGNTLVGTDTKNGYVYAYTGECRPTVSVTATPTDYSSLTGSATTLIKGMSNVAISATATPKFSATIKKIVTNNSTLATNNTTGSTTFPKVETNTFTTTVTDSRGYDNYPLDTKTFTMVPYVKLTVSANIYRTNATSSTVKAVITGNYFNGSFGSQNNTLTLTWKWKLKSDSTYTTGGTLTTTKTNNTYTTGEITLGTSFDYDKDYDFLFTAVDKMLTVTANPPVKRGLPIYDYGVDSNGNNYLWVNGNLYTNENRVYPVEEGTWTPVITTNEGVAPTMTYTTQKGHYKKIGNLVFISFYIRGKITALNGTNNYGVVGGLPFQSKSLSIGENAISMGVLYQLLENTTNVKLVISGRQIRPLYNNGAVSDRLIITPTSTQSSYCEIGGSGWYEVG